MRSRRPYWCCKQIPWDLNSFSYAGAHDLERANPILGLCHDRVFTDQFIFRHILGHFLPQEKNLHHVYERIRSITYPKGKPNVIKRQKISFLGCRFCWLVCWILKIFKIRAKTVLKINWSVKTPWHERMEVARSWLWAPVFCKCFLLFQQICMDAGQVSENALYGCLVVWSTDHGVRGGAFSPR